MFIYFLTSIKCYVTLFVCLYFLQINIYLQNYHLHVMNFLYGENRCVKMKLDIVQAVLLTEQLSNQNPAYPHI